MVINPSNWAHKPLFSLSLNLKNRMAFIWDKGLFCKVLCGT